MVIARAKSLARDYKLYKHLQTKRDSNPIGILAKRDCNNCKSQVLLEPQGFIWSSKNLIQHINTLIILNINYYFKKLQNFIKIINYWKDKSACIF